ncbi:MAG: carboxy terminal-processing peptidase [Spirochaetes bacterium]|nr:carboxy terminal-processing peptidase [Spirochaetota bacterium]
MSLKNLKFIFYLFIYLILTAKPSFTLNSLNEKTINLINILENYHYSSLKINDEILNDIKKIFINNIDPNALYFTEEDINKLLSLNLSIEDFKKGKTTHFFNEVLICYRERLNQANDLISLLLENSLTYQEKESITFSLKNQAQYSKNSNELKIRWKKLLKFKILNILYYKTGFSEKEIIDKNILLKNEKIIRESIKKKEKSVLNRILNNPEGFENYLSYQFLNAVSARFDPHTMLFSLIDKLNFQSILSTELYSFGIYLKQENTCEIKIDYIAAGGPAWKSLKLNNDDIILEFKLPDDNNRIIEISDLSLSDAYKILNDLRNINIIIKVRKKSGQIEEVFLKKEKILNPDNIIISFILSGKKKIGYIYLPSFYTEWQKEYVFGCANDIAKVIIKLKKEKIEGLILDIRNNSGGSIQEALNLAGIFINEGALCLQGIKDGKPLLLKDMNRGIIYDDPMILIINEYSASASELLASVLKDYNRAVILGNSTFGKASAQVLLPVIKDNKNISISTLKKFNKNNDYIKITVNKFYNLSGETFQLKGISPHIELSALSLNPGYNENFLLYALKNDKIERSINFNKGNELPINELKKLSIKRIENDKNFMEIKKLKSELEKYNKSESQFSLYLDDFINDIKERDEIYHSINKLFKRSSDLFKTENSIYDKEIINFDKYSKALNERQIRDIQEDIIIEEAFNIINDYINILKK